MPPSPKFRHWQRLAERLVVDLKDKLEDMATAPRTIETGPSTEDVLVAVQWHPERSYDVSAALARPLRCIFGCRTGVGSLSESRQ